MAKLGGVKTHSAPQLVLLTYSQFSRAFSVLESSRIGRASYFHVKLNDSQMG